MTQEQMIDDQSLNAIENQAMPEAQQPAEKMVNLPQKEIGHAFQVAKAAAFEKGKQEAMREMQSQQSSAGISPEEFDRRVAEATQKHIEQVRKQMEEARVNEYTQKVASDFLSRLDSAQDEHPELKEFATSGTLSGFPNTIMLSMEVDNTSDLMAELKDNPSGLQVIEGLTKSDPSGRLARQAIKKISESIKANKAVKQRQTPNQPLSHIKPSNVGVDNGSAGVTVSDLRKMFR